MTTIYAELGATGGIRTAVDRFYERVLADPALTPYFAGVDVGRVRRHQVRVLATLTGGPGDLADLDLGAAHEHLDLTGAEVARVVDHLVETLRELAVAEPTIARIGDALAPYADKVASR